MDKNNGLLTKIAAEFNIKRGYTETEENYKARIIYSVICRLSYASLWDDSTVSIQHFKNKIDELLKIYLELYPEVKISEKLSEEIYDLYLKTGNFYHQSHNISASIFSAAKQENILFLRGVNPAQKVFMSGAGFYLPSNSEKNFDTSKNLSEMFLLQDKTLQDFWQEIINSANWQEIEVTDAEFLEMSPSSNKKYWQDKPVCDGRISLARNGEFEPRNYYLYKFEGKKFLRSRLENWQTSYEFFAEVKKDSKDKQDEDDDANKKYKPLRGGIYRQIACACLANYKILPPIKFKNDGAITQVKIEYLPPPAELYLLILYSWAKNPQILPNNFERIFDAQIFFALKEVFEKIGYKFVEENF